MISRTYGLFDPVSGHESSEVNCGPLSETSGSGISNEEKQDGRHCILFVEVVEVIRKTSIPEKHVLVFSNVEMFPHTFGQYPRMHWRFTRKITD